MKRTLNFTFVLALLFIFACNRNSNYNSKNVDAIYPDTILPAESPQIFAAGKISTGYFERDAAFTVDGTEFYFSVNRTPHSVILVVKKVAGTWQEPEVASFSGQFSDIEPFCSPDGNRIYFASDRPLESNSTAVKDYDIWYVEKDDAQWSAAKNAGLPLNTTANEFYPTVSKNNNLCFCALRDDSFGGEDLYISKILPTGFSEPQNLGDSINSTANEYNAFLAPDESYIIYNSESRKFGNLCISFKINDNLNFVICQFIRRKQYYSLLILPFTYLCGIKDR